MGVTFQAATWEGGAPLVTYRTVDGAAAFLAGALVLTDTDGEIIECGADPAIILGVAMAKPQTAPGYNMANNADIVWAHGRENKVAVLIARGTTTFAGRGVNGGTDPVVPLLTHLGEQYGVLKTGANEWVIDFADTTNKRVQIVGIDIDKNLFFFRFITANTEEP